MGDEEEEENGQQFGNKSEQSEAESIPDSLEMPEEWKSIPLADMIDKGWKPRVRRIRNKEFISIRKGKLERGMGAYTPERWDLLIELFPKLTANFPDPIAEGIPISQTPERSIASAGLLGTKMTRPEALSAHVGFSLETLNWYEWTKSKGFTGTLSDFVDSIIHNYFSEHGLQPVVMIERIEGGN
ncbi:hypothetical protein MUP77_25180 [Candidatus Bathyarchaeota archaeon]|nr:hypothetical protein [Candidatus Bathyarchaeota archaeon]